MDKQLKEFILRISLDGRPVEEQLAILRKNAELTKQQFESVKTSAEMWGKMGEMKVAHKMLTESEKLANQRHTQRC